VIDDLRAICRKYGFKPELVGASTTCIGWRSSSPQSRDRSVLAQSLFVGIAWIVARSVRGALAMIVSLTLVPLCMLGGIGWFRVPMDVISAPAPMCIGIAIDEIHPCFRGCRAQRDGKKGWAAGGRAWEQWRGSFIPTDHRRWFCHFRLVRFSTTQRFGLVVLAAVSLTSCKPFSSCRCLAAPNGKEVAQPSFRHRRTRCGEAVGQRASCPLICFKYIVDILRYITQSSEVSVD